MNALPVYNNPALAVPREPYAAVLTCGRKLAGGGMEAGSTSRFWIGTPVGADRKTARPLHPGFRRFNESSEGKASARAYLRCLLIHSDLDDARQIARKLYRGPANDRRVTNPQHQGPWCMGDGSTATRWDGEDYGEIDCPGEDCPFAQGATGCKVETRLLLMPRWDGTPFADCGMTQVPMLYASKGRRMKDSLEGLFRHVRAMAAGFDTSIESWFGLPFTMTLGIKRTANGAYTDVAFSPDGDLVDWMRSRRATVAQLAAPSPVGLLAETARSVEAEGIAEDLTSPDPVGPVASLKPALVSADDERGGGSAPEAGQIGLPGASVAGPLPEADRRRWEARISEAGLMDKATGDPAVGIPPEWTTDTVELLVAIMKAAE